MRDAPNKFKQMMQTAREHQATTGDAPTEEPAQEQPTPKAKRAPATERRGRGRPATGKRSDPDYESTTVFLRKETKTAAAHLLLGDRGRDLSDVLEKLLSGWGRTNS
jgi:hypothetical protein